MNIRRSLAVVGIAGLVVACQAGPNGPLRGQFNQIAPLPMPTVQSENAGFIPLSTGDRILTDPGRIHQLEAEAAARESGIPIGAARVPYHGQLPVGAIMINFQARLLFFIESSGSAIRYPIAIGAAEGAEMTAGSYTITRKAEWPEWRPTARMRAEDPSLPAVVSGGAHSPLGAAALYLGDTLFRIHGTNEPETIGQAVSSGCIRMYNNHVVNLFDRVAVGATVHLIRGTPFTPGIDGPSLSGTPKI